MMENFRERSPAVGTKRDMVLMWQLKGDDFRKI
jgi:hypothetical protein